MTSYTWKSDKRADLVQLAGKYPNQKTPLPIGLECSGYIESVGEAVESLKVGDPVMSLLDGWVYWLSISTQIRTLLSTKPLSFSGGQADMVNVNSDFVMPLKSDFSLEKAGGIAETFLTAYQLLHLVGEVQPTDRVLVHAAGSGVGTSAIQLGTM